MSHSDCGIFLFDSSKSTRWAMRTNHNYGDAIASRAVEIQEPNRVVTSVSCEHFNEDGTPVNATAMIRMISVIRFEILW